MKTTSRVVLSTALLAAVAGAHAETSAVSPTGFRISVVRDIAAPPARVYRLLGEPARWWSPAHTWSGDAGNLKLEPRAGGCFCERWNGNEVEHGRVINATQDALLRLQAPLGPLQALPVNAVLGFELAGTEGRTKLTVSFLVAGGGMDLSQLAAPVDGVITEQVDRLVRLATAQ
jgi:uncharacterized protein YndB with AHSA1/START domain